MSNTEIEIKVRVDDSQPLVKFLEKNGTFESKKHQIDEYYTPAHRNFLDVRPVKEWLRLRQEDGQQSINYKNWHYEANGETYHCDEYEVAIDDMAKTKLIFQSVDIKPLIVVDKVRRTFRYHDFEFALDSVKDLGDYVEVEYKGKEPSSSPKEITTEMVKLLEGTGCKILERDFSGYPFLLLKKNYGLEIAI